MHLTLSWSIGSIFCIALDQHHCLRYYKKGHGCLGRNKLIATCLPLSTPTYAHMPFIPFGTVVRRTSWIGRVSDVSCANAHLPLCPWSSSSSSSSFLFTLLFSSSPFPFSALHLHPFLPISLPNSPLPIASHHSPRLYADTAAGDRPLSFPLAHLRKSALLPTIIPFSASHTLATHQSLVPSP